MLEGYGADIVVDEAEFDAKAVKEATGNCLKLGLNQIGGASVSNMIKAMGDSATVVTIGGMTGEPVRFPTRFDQTLIPAGEIGRYIVTARRAGDRWYLGALTNWDAREVEVKLDFLGDGRWKARIFRDGVNADRYGEDYLLEERTVTAADSLAMAMAPGGGYAVQFERVQ